MGWRTHPDAVRTQLINCIAAHIQIQLSFDLLPRHAGLADVAFHRCAKLHQILQAYTGLSENVPLKGLTCSSRKAGSLHPIAELIALIPCRMNVRFISRKVALTHEDVPIARPPPIKMRAQFKGVARGTEGFR
jgi:hypothetical protein